MTELVLLPGLHGDAQSWSPVIHALPEDLTARALDLPAVPDLDVLVDEVAGRIAPGSVVVGHSLGAVVAMHLAERHPTLVAGLALVTAPVGAEDPDTAAARAARAAGLSSDSYEEIALDGMELVFDDRGLDPQVRAERLRAARGYGPARFAAHSVALGARADRSSFPAQARCPVLIVGASDDQVVPTAEQRAWAVANDACGGGGTVSYVEIRETGHMLPVEAPEELALEIHAWVREELS
ncbi:alpha/beta fold hydrolase [uncultured Dietzia sp.]|uniref:alpha/beta fold hydrolase n=1 Tax=uncultured Dietzia sp. TaxID=395519 RepID=UPI0025D6D7CC|nr:alpha/beta hydrolase [uncultured Dietzia sp.]